MKKFLSLVAMLMVSASISFAQDTWTVAGSAAALNGSTDWAPAEASNDMVDSGDGVNFTLTVTDCTLEKGTTYQFKVVKNHAWAEAYPGTNKEFSVAETAKYTVEYTFNATSHDVGVSTTKTGEAGVISHTYTVAGVAALVGSEWDPTDATNDMVLDGGVYKLTKNNVHLAAATYEFKVTVDHSWGTAYPAKNWELPIYTEADYDILITFDESTKEITCTATQISTAIGIGSTGWGTWYTADKALDFSGMSFSAYTATCDGSTVTLTKVNDVDAGTAFVMKGAEGTYYVPFKGSSSSTDKGALEFYTDYSVTDEDSYYIYGLVYRDGKAQFAQVKVGENVGGHVILRVAKGGGAREALDVVFADEATGISAIENAANAGVYYNLQGVRVAQPTKGLYIVNGKKVVMK